MGRPATAGPTHAAQRTVGLRELKRALALLQVARRDNDPVDTRGPRAGEHVGQVGRVHPRLAVVLPLVHRVQQVAAYVCHTVGVQGGGVKGYWLG